MTQATIDDFKKIEIRAGLILTAEIVPDSNKLAKLSVDLGEETPRQIIAGIAPYFPDLSDIVGKKFAFIANLEPRTIRGLLSQGMILATGEDDKLSLLSIDSEIPAGSLVR